MAIGPDSLFQVRSQIYSPAYVNSKNSCDYSLALKSVRLLNCARCHVTRPKLFNNVP